MKILLIRYYCGGKNKVQPQVQSGIFSDPKKREALIEYWQKNNMLKAQEVVKPVVIEQPKKTVIEEEVKKELPFLAQLVIKKVVEKNIKEDEKEKHKIEVKKEKRKREMEKIREGVREKWIKEIKEKEIWNIMYIDWRGRMYITGIYNYQNDKEIRYRIYVREKEMGSNPTLCVVKNEYK